MLRVTVLLSTLVALAAGGCGSPSVPPSPSYEVDVRPILMARCARCHGAGDKLNAPPGVDGAGLQQTNFYLDRYDDEGDCTADPTNCKKGAKTAASLLPTVIRNAPAILAMPPPPSPALDDWAVDILNNWSKNPVCSNSATPDLRVCPNGP